MRSLVQRSLDSNSSWTIQIHMTGSFATPWPVKDVISGGLYVNPDGELFVVPYIDQYSTLTSYSKKIFRKLYSIPIFQLIRLPVLPAQCHLMEIHILY